MNRDNIAGWLFAAVVLIMSAVIGHYGYKDRVSREALKVSNPLKYRQERCTARAWRARPACWDELDWEVYCQRIECK